MHGMPRSAGCDAAHARNLLHRLSLRMNGSQKEPGLPIGQPIVDQQINLLTKEKNRQGDLRCG